MDHTFPLLHLPPPNADATATATASHSAHVRLDGSNIACAAVEQDRHVRACGSSDILVISSSSIGNDVLCEGALRSLFKLKIAIEYGRL